MRLTRRRSDAILLAVMLAGVAVLVTVAHPVIVLAACGGIVAIIAGLVFFLYRRHTLVYWAPDNDEIIGRELRRRGGSRPYPGESVRIQAERPLIRAGGSRDD